MKKFNFIAVALTAVLILVGCFNDTNASKNTPDNPTDNKITSLQTVIDGAKEGDKIDLSKYPDITDYNAEINKQVTVSGNSTDMQNSTLTVNADGVSISGISSASVTASSDLGNGTLKISSSSLSSLTINGGGINSIVISDVTVDKVTIDKQKSNDNASDQYVRLCIDGAANILNLNIGSSALIDLSSDSSTDKFDLSAINITIQADNSNDIINVAVRDTINMNTPEGKVKADFSVSGTDSGNFYVFVSNGATIKEDFYQQVSNKIANREINDDIIKPTDSDGNEFNFDTPITPENTSFTVIVPDKPNDPESGSGSESESGSGSESESGSGSESGSESEQPHEHTFSKDSTDDLTSDATHHWHICETCGATDDKVEHSWNDGDVSTDPTVGNAGVKICTCTVCGRTKTEPIKALDATPAITITPEYAEYSFSLAVVGNSDSELEPNNGVYQIPLGSSIKVCATDSSSDDVTSDITASSIALYQNEDKVTSVSAPLTDDGDLSPIAVLPIPTDLVGSGYRLYVTQTISGVAYDKWFSIEIVKE